MYPPKMSRPMIYRLDPGRATVVLEICAFERGTILMSVE
jgi:hypothetical protein